MNQKRISEIVETMFGLYSNPVEVLQKATGSARSTISKFFNNKRIKPYTRNALYRSCVALVAKKLEEQEELDKKFDTLVKRYKNR
ncbi:hypothetical protein ACFO3O_17490 [Dokdonia ponticola]|uniref:XRE family transcriptional regulator n=1 Tax=Dokdonia ponticola TaxID=2041041 RepID=A0ABV9HUK5_9FLAO|nr:hypothetical protein [uncultured Dokdonia sp.]